jgi:hypothetical protein
MTAVGYARVSSTGPELEVQISKLTMCERVFKENGQPSMPIVLS